MTKTGFVIIKLAGRFYIIWELKYEETTKDFKRKHWKYAPLAHRLGMAKIKSELEDTAFIFTQAFFGINDTAWKRLYWILFIQTIVELYQKWE